ncbi:Rha family transcriptional regulator [Campylobacter lari]|uniref:Rha family transcriptional regulator n=1 Tax=Campylobacter lari TaxID=201 RepID=UPI0021F707AB|nr:Rha family transcriptional regulator [Campylobacter lari]MCW0240718.1 Rha family transcriptional regulator [Campylobacter lari]MCW0248601.1 Rha family transcriptional regulator [Campylobacter lari]
MEKLAVINGVGVELEVANDQVTTTSLDIAAVFNKRHDNIIAKIETFPKDSFTDLNFKASKYTDSTGRVLPCYKITRDGFSLLVMGFTGEKAYKWKLAFINAFNEMEKRLKNIKAEQMQKLAFRQSLGYKSQLKQQKLKYENEIKALKYDLEHKNELSLKRKLSDEELLELRKFLAKDYEIVCFKKWEYMLFAESISRKNYKLDKANGFCVYKSIEEKFNSRLDYYKHYDEYEEKWGNLLRR